MPLYHNSTLNLGVGEIPCYYQHTCTRSRYWALALAIAARTNYAVLADAHQLFHLPVRRCDPSHDRPAAARGGRRRLVPARRASRADRSSRAQ